jgi:ribosome-associated heat shock protein Hsp15
MSEDGHPCSVRIDKWLWAARFFKTRSLANQAVEGGKVRVNGTRVKPAKEVRPGDELEISIGETLWTVVVQAIAERRGPAPDARRLYTETDASAARRLTQSEARRLQPPVASDLRGRPTKRHRREIDRLRRAN